MDPRNIPPQSSPPEVVATQPNLTPPINSPKLNWSTFLVLLIIGLLIIIVLLLGGFYLLPNQTSKSTINVLPTAVIPSSNVIATLKVQEEAIREANNVLIFKFNGLDSFDSKVNKGEVRLTLPEGATVNLKQTKVKEKFGNGSITDVILSDTDATIGSSRYYITNTRGWVGGGLLCDCSVSEVQLQNPDKKLKMTISIWRNSQGIQVIQPSDITVGDFYWRTFNIYKGPLTTSQEMNAKTFTGIFTDEEVNMWKKILQDNFVVMPI